MSNEQGSPLAPIMPSTHEPPPATDAAAGPALWRLLAVATGVTVASLYYAQPILGLLGSELHASDRAIGFVPVLTQIGYAIGLFFLAPLGDRFDRRRIILVKALVLAVSLALAGSAPSLAWLLAASLLIGLSATLAQDIVPAAAALAPAGARGRVVGTVMTGLLTGILLSRTVGGFVADRYGFRVLFHGAAIAIVALTFALARGLPTFAPKSTLSYGALVASIAALVRQHAPLRRAALAQGLLSLGFGAFWSTLALMLHRPPFSLGATVAGAFGLAGAAGALAAPLAGRLADKHGPELVTRLAAALAAVSFASMALGPLLSTRAHLVLLVVAAIGFDFGIQASLVSHQTIVYGLDPAAQSRLNAVLMTGVFIGMASGAALGAQALAVGGWLGVTALTTLAALGALVVRLSTKSGGSAL